MSEDQLSGLKFLHAIGVRLVPERPTADMCEAARAACGGDLDTEIIRRIYGAMLIVAGDCSLHGENSLH